MTTHRTPQAPQVPVVALTGRLGAGKTTVLNHLLGRPGGRVGVVVNDFGAINVDAGLVTGHVDEAASITGGCVCCLPDAGGLDEALERLTDPRLRLDVVIVEASGVADPLALARLIRFSGAERVRPGGVVEVVDATEHADPIDAYPVARLAAATLVAVTKTERLPRDGRAAAVARIAARVAEVNARTPVVPAPRGRVDPALVFDIDDAEDPPDQLPIAALVREVQRERAREELEHNDHAEPGHDSDDADQVGHGHVHAVTELAHGPADAGAVVDLLESPPDGAYRLKGCVPIRTPRGERRYLVNLVGRSIHVATAPARAARGSGGSVVPDGLVAIGPHLDEKEAGHRLRAALTPAGSAGAQGLRRLQRYRRLSR
ncbi:CobW family GTP-binding protein [Salana multivorans]